MHRKRRDDFNTLVRVFHKDVCLDGYCVNLSEEGAGCIIRGSLAAGETVLLELCLDSGSTMRLAACVQHSKLVMRDSPLWPLEFPWPQDHLGYYYGFGLLRTSPSTAEDIRTLCRHANSRRHSSLRRTPI